MKKVWFILLLICFLTVSVSAEEITVPDPPDHVQDFLPEEDSSFAQGLWHIVTGTIRTLRPDIGNIALSCASVIAAVLLLSLLRSFEGAGKETVELCGIVVISLLLLKPANTLIDLGADTIRQISEYGKLLIPVMTAAMAAQGGAVSSAALYTATAFFSSILSSAVSKFLVPMVYIYILLSVVNAAAGDELMKKARDFIKWLMTWGLKLSLYLFTGYIGITGVVSGTTDQAALKATKLTISGMVPVIGGILSDASETILVSAGLVKNAAGISGMLVILALTVGPFLRIGLQYLFLKLTAAVCSMFADKKLTGIIEDFSVAMSLILAMTGTLCMMLLISVVCFLKGMG